MGCVLQDYNPHIYFAGESGLVYCGYLDGGDGRSMVAIKTCKGKKYLFSSVTPKH